MRVTVRFQADPRTLAQMHTGDVTLVRAINELAAGATLLDVTTPRPDMREASLALQAQREQEGWVFNNQPLRAGGPFSLRTSTYELNGIIVSVEPDKTK